MTQYTKDVKFCYHYKNIFIHTVMPSNPTRWLSQHSVKKNIYQENGAMREFGKEVGIEVTPHLKPLKAERYTFHQYLNTNWIIQWRNTESLNNTVWKYHIILNMQHT